MCHQHRYHPPRAELGLHQNHKSKRVKALTAGRETPKRCRRQDVILLCKLACKEGNKVCYSHVYIFSYKWKATIPSGQKQCLSYGTYARCPYTKGHWDSSRATSIYYAIGMWLWWLVCTFVLHASVIEFSPLHIFEQRDLGLSWFSRGLLVP